MARTTKYVKFKFPISAYQPDALRAGYSERELRAEYSRLRDVAEKRLKRLESSEFAESQTVRYNKGRFKTLADISSTGELTHLMTDLARFLTAELSTVTGQRSYRRKSVESLREGGLTGVTTKNFGQVTRVLDWASGFKEYDPSELMRMLSAYAEAGISVQEVYNNLRELYEQWIQTHEVIPREDWDE